MTADTPASWRQEVVVLGRVSYDLNPLQSRTKLEDVRTFERWVGGFAGNVATGLARLQVPTLIISAVGDDPHGRYIRHWLKKEGVDDAGLADLAADTSSGRGRCVRIPDRAIDLE